MLVGGRAEGGVNFNIVPNEFAFTIDRRPNADEDYAEARAELLAVLEDIRQRGGIDLEWEVVQDAESATTDAGHPLVQSVASAVEQRTGQQPTVTCCPGVLETRIYRRLGIPALAFGPGLIERMHSPDEDVPVANLAAAAAVYVDVAAEITSTGRIG